MNQAELVKVGVLGYEDEVIEARMAPDVGIAGLGQTHKSDMG